MKLNFKRGLAVFLSVTLLCGLIPTFTGNTSNVKADTNSRNTATKTIAGLGTGIIKNPTVPTASTDAWAGSYVYFGTYGGNPVKYRVLDKDSTDFGGTTMLLDCDTVLWTGSDPSSVFDPNSNDWATSDIKRYLNSEASSADTYDYSTIGFLTTSFSTTEQNAIAESSKTSAITGKDGDGASYIGWTSLSGEKIFFLDAKEATNTSYGYYDTNYGATGRIKTGGNALWWLRSPSTDKGLSDAAGYVSADGEIILGIVGDYYFGVSPAFNINLSSVLFSSVISGTAGETGAEYKLTLLDDNLTIAGNGAVTRNADTVSIPYTISGANSTNATQVSILILDREYSDATKDEAMVKYYGALDTSAGNGTGTFTLPAELSDKMCEGEFYAYIVAEDINGEKETDYASAPVSITIPWKAPTVNPINIGTTALYTIPGGWNNTYGVKVWFGHYNGSLTSFRVLGSNDDTMSTSNTGLLLDCDVVLDNSYMSFNQSNVNKWEESNIRTFLGGVNYYSDENVFTPLEKSAILETTLKNLNEYTVNTDSFIDYESTDNVFLLSAKEMNELYWDDASRIKLDRGGNGAHCWLRSTNADNSGYVASFYSSGVIDAYDYNNVYIRVSPALNLNISSVLLTSMNGQVKSDAITRESDIFTNVNNRQWKLTLLDSGKNIKITDNEKTIIESNGTITVPYTYTDTATTVEEKVNQISVMITDKVYTESDANILYYGALQNTTINSTTGTGTFELPSALDGKVIGTDYHVYILAEHTTNTNATDYASVPIEVDIYDEVNNFDIKVDAPVAKSALDTSATVSSEIETAAVTWMDGEHTVTGEAEYDTAYTVKVTLTAIDGYAITENTEITINGNAVTVVKNNDGTVTVSYTFPATELGIITHTASGYEGIYDGNAHSITVNIEALDGATITYSLDAGENKTYSATKPIFTDEGTYIVYYKIEKENYETITGSITVKITATNDLSDGNNPPAVVDPDAGINIIAVIASIFIVALGGVIMIKRRRILE